jgi:O-antigen ligase
MLCLAPVWLCLFTVLLSLLPILLGLFLVLLYLLTVLFCPLPVLLGLLLVLLYLLTVLFCLLPVLLGPPCSGHEKIPVCRCRLLPVRSVTCVAMGLRGLFGVEVRAKRACGKGAVNSQHGSGVEGSLHPYTKCYHPK